MDSALSDLYAAVREVPDFPKPGILFRDITPILLDCRLFRQAVKHMIEPVRGLSLDKIVAVESRGFLFAAPMALELGVGLVPARKVGKLPWETLRFDYQLEYGADAIEIHLDAIRPRERVLIVDDVLATGGTARAAAEVVGRAGGTVAGVSLLIELAELGGRSQLAGTPVFSVLRYPRQ